MIAEAHRVCFERVGQIVNDLSPFERARILDVLTGEIAGSKSDRLLVSALEQLGGAEILRIALTAVRDGNDSVDSLLDRVGG